MVHSFTISEIPKNLLFSSPQLYLILNFTVRNQAIRAHSTFKTHFCAHSNQLKTMRNINRRQRICFELAEEECSHSLSAFWRIQTSRPPQQLIRVN